VFDTLTTSFKSAIGKIRFKDDANALKRALGELKKSLLKADVHHKVVKDLLSFIERDTKAKGIGRDEFLLSIKENLETILTAPGNQGFVYAPNGVTSILMSGLQGSGKTTTTVKLAYYLKLRRKKVLIAAADLQRLAAVEQLKQLTQEYELDLYFNDDTKNPVEVVKGAIAKAKDGAYDVLLVDTAGRLAIDDVLMDELKEVKNTLNPNEVFYVADAMTGQDAVKTAQRFDEKIGINGVILSKYDGDSKGGVAIGIAHQLKLPLRFIGSGEKAPDFDTFIPERIVGRILGEGDLASLAEKTSAIMDEGKAKALTKKIRKGEFNFNDFLEQMESLKKLGSMKSVIGMIPGLSNMIPKDLDIEGSGEMKNIKAMISSMTPKEREQPSLLNTSRKKRIASGCGLSEAQIKKLLKQFSNAGKMAKKFSGKKGMQDLQNMMSQMKGMNIPR